MIPASLRDRKRRAEVVSGLAPENDARRTKSGLENICLRAGLAASRSLQHWTPVGDGYRDLSTGWHWHDTGGNLNLKKKSPTNKNSATAPDAEQAISFSQCVPVQCGFVFSSRSCLWLCFWSGSSSFCQGGGPPALLHTRAPHLSFRCGISPCRACRARAQGCSCLLPCSRVSPAQLRGSGLKGFTSLLLSLKIWN